MEESTQTIFSSTLKTGLLILKYQIMLFSMFFNQTSILLRKVQGTTSSVLEYSSLKCLDD